MKYKLKCSKCKRIRQTGYANYMFYKDKKNTCRKCYLKSLEVDVLIHDKKFPVKCPICKKVFLKSYKHFIRIKNNSLSKKCFKCSRFKKGQTNSGGIKKGSIPWNKGTGNTGYWQRIKTSKEWKEMRRKVFERDNYTCQKCYKKGGILHPDHIKPKIAFPELVFEPKNVRTLCRDCHKQTDTYGYKAKQYKIINQLK